jgi:hypothetical protein
MFRDRLWVTLMLGARSSCGRATCIDLFGPVLGSVIFYGGWPFCRVAGRGCARDSPG